jgi:methyl-accepting chemotaxis protein
LAATSEELSGQAEQLQQSVAFFDTGSGSSASAPSRHDAGNKGRNRAAPRLSAPLTPTAVRGGGSSNFRPY